MFYIISKVVWFFLQPSSLLISCVLLGTLLLWTRRQRLAKTFLSFGGLGLIVAGFTPLGSLMMLPLEDRFPRPVLKNEAELRGIIVLGGFFSDPLMAQKRKVMALNEAAERIIASTALTKRFPKARFILSGGSSQIILSKLPEAKVVKQYLLPALTIPPDRVELEDRSLNTYENAIYTKALAKPDENGYWLLVTSAYHIPRSIGCFRQAGFKNIVAWPVDYRTMGPWDLRFFNVPSEGLKQVDLAAKEWVGLFVYWLTGKTNELFPGPK